MEKLQTTVFCAMNYSRAPEMILPGLAKRVLGVFFAAVKPEHQSGFSKLRCNAMRWPHRLIIASCAGYPASTDVWDARVYYRDFTTDTNEIITARKISWMGAHLNKMPLRLHAPDPPDLRALFQLLPNSANCRC